MVELDEIEQFSPSLDAEIHALVVEIRAIVNNFELDSARSTEDHQPITQIIYNAVLSKSNTVVEPQASLTVD
ncbi:Integrase catalytic domain-containing protein [Aphis craccivora]|uniref:Integrase catalytic domain-containing protein n=1 Tax=Aphis craccivora TaxID=307492 RepID=A0A6G0YG20_APHCR|nr:Integrase catalytic domain-containing protein [Aphis craccivora]